MCDDIDRSSSHTNLGKIIDVECGFSGYDDCMIGFTFTLGNDDWRTQDFWGTWFGCGNADNAPEAVNKIYAETTVRVAQLLKAAKVKCLQELVDKPVAVTFGSRGQLHEWRILTEVL